MQYSTERARTSTTIAKLKGQAKHPIRFYGDCNAGGHELNKAFLVCGVMQTVTVPC